MNRILNGIDIVNDLAGGREWWRLRACDVQRWVATLPPSATQEGYSRIEWMGDAWDGASDIAVGHRTVRGQDAILLLRELRRGIAALGIGSVVIPDYTSVRQCFAPFGSHQLLAVDIDFGDFILPVGVEDRWLPFGEHHSVASVASGMLKLIKEAHRRRDAILDRELRLRRALEETTKTIGDGAAPLWLRRNPIPFDEHPAYLSRPTYLMLIAALNEGLVWAPLGCEDVTSVRDVRDNHRSSQRTQRRRAATLAGLRAAGSEGMISDMALALIQERGMNPAEVFRQAAAARVADRRGVVAFERNGGHETLTVHEGALLASFGFEGGHHHCDTLTLWGDYPETLATAAKGRKLSDFVDHPVLVASGAVVRKASARRGALDLEQAVRRVSVEDADARWREAHGTSGDARLAA